MRVFISIYVKNCDLADVKEGLWNPLYDDSGDDVRDASRKTGCAFWLAVVWVVGDSLMSCDWIATSTTS